MAVKLLDTLNVNSTDAIEYNIFECAFGKCFIAKLNTTILKLSILQHHNEIENEIAELKLSFPNTEIKLNTTINEPIFEPNIILNYSVFIYGTAFQKQVWHALLNIPFGETSTYEKIAIAIGKTALASRAVGIAIGSNTIAFLIPCHRVVNKNGKIGNFRWGTETKKALLKWEMTHKKDSTTLF